MSAPTKVNPFLAEQGPEEALKLRLAFTGTSGSGKTYSALSVATALLLHELTGERLQAAVASLASKIAVIDTERKSSRRYRVPRGPFRFTPVDLDGDFHPRRYIDLMRFAADAGAEVLIVDSLSHAWEGKNGILDLVDQAGGRLQDWKKVKPYERELLEAMLDFPGHILVTLRTKSAYEDVEDRNGKTSKKKVGLQAVQREGIEYEFDVVLRVAEARAHVEKTRCEALFDIGTIDRPGANLVKVLRPWLDAGVRTEQPAPAKASAPSPAKPDTKVDTAAAELHALIDQLQDEAKRTAARKALDGAKSAAEMQKIRARVEQLLAEQAPAQSLDEQFPIEAAP